MKPIRTQFLLAAAILAAVLATPVVGPWAAVACVILVASCLTAPRLGQCNAGPTLSVPEILQDVLEAFRLELFALKLFSTDFSSKTAVLNDKITAHIDVMPVGANYDPTPGKGFYSGAQDVTTLIQDVPVTLSQFKHVPVKIGWLTQLSSRLPLYQRAVKNIGRALAKIVLDQTLGQIATSFSYTSNAALANCNLDTLEFLRGQLNAQKAASHDRFGIIGSPLAAAIQNDDRVKSDLFYGTLNGDQGYRRFTNLAGFANIIEYPDFPTAGNGLGLFGDPRAVVLASRRPDFSNAAAMLGIPQIMELYPMEDPETGLNMTGVGWQEPGTGDVYVSAAILFGLGLGNQGGAAGTITDKAGYFLTGQ